MGRYREEITLAGDESQKNLWLRKIRVTFSSLAPDSNGKGYSLTLGDDVENNLNITVNGVKHLAVLRDNGTVTITNLGYDTLALIMALQLFQIKVEFGYESNSSLITIFKGQVSYISQKIHAKHDTTTYITYASNYVAQWSQKRINFNINSGVNLYSTLNYLFENEGQSALISPELKKIVLDKVKNEYGKATNIIDSVMGDVGGTYSMNTDDTINNTVISITNLEEKRRIKLNPNQISIANGNPTLTSQGLNINLFITMAFIPGDIIIVDASMIDLSSGMQSQESMISTFNSAWLSTSNEYIIREIKYTFGTREETALYNINAVSTTLAENIAGAH